MCECTLIKDSRTNKPIEIPATLHKFMYLVNEKSTVLLEHLPMQGIINYVAMHKITDMYGVKNGYIFVIGEEDTD